MYSYVLLMRLSCRGEWREVEERVSSGEGGERLQLVGRWRRRSWSRAGVGGGGEGGVGGVDGGGGETQSWSRAGVWRRCHLRGWPGLLNTALALLLLFGGFATGAAGVSLSLASHTSKLVGSGVLNWQCVCSTQFNTLCCLVNLLVGLR